MSVIDYYVFPLSPFNYLAGEQLEQIAAKHGVAIRYKPFDLFHVFGAHGTLPPGKRHVSRQAYRMQELARVAKFVDLPITLKPAHWPTDPKPAICALIYAQEEGGGDLGKLSFSLLRACWAEEKDIASADVVAECLSAAGFDAAIAQKDPEQALAIYAQNTDEALAANVFGAPSYVYGDQVFWGQDRLAYLDAYLADPS